jgi:hypothetical protein
MKATWDWASQLFTPFLHAQSATAAAIAGAHSFDLQYRLWITLVGAPVSVRYFFQQYEQEWQIYLSPGWSFRIR